MKGHNANSRPQQQYTHLCLSVTGADCQLTHIRKKRVWIQVVGLRPSVQPHYQPSIPRWMEGFMSAKGTSNLSLACVSHATALLLVESPVAMRDMLICPPREPSRNTIRLQTCCTSLSEPYMYTGTCIPVHVYRYMYTSTCIQVYTCIPVHVYRCVYKDTATCIQVHVYRYMYITTCIQVHVYRYMYITTCIQVHVHNYMYTGTCIQVHVQRYMYTGICIDV